MGEPLGADAVTLRLAQLYSIIIFKVRVQQEPDRKDIKGLEGFENPSEDTIRDNLDRVRYTVSIECIVLFR